MHIVLGGAKPREAKLGAPQWWIARIDYSWRLREQGQAEAGKGCGWSQEIAHSGKFEHYISF